MARQKWLMHGYEIPCWFGVTGKFFENFCLFRVAECGTSCLRSFSQSDKKLLATNRGGEGKVGNAAGTPSQKSEQISVRNWKIRQNRPKSGLITWAWFGTIGTRRLDQHLTPHPGWLPGNWRKG
jgi:hypothetical protein